VSLLTNHLKDCLESANYDDVSANYDYSRRAGKDDSALLIKLLDLQYNAHVLEVGCGTGNYLEKLKDKVSFLIGLDGSQKMLVRAKSKSPHIKLIRANAEYLPFPDQSFDAIYCIQVLHHISDRHKFTSEIFRTLKQGGRFVLQTCSHEQLLSFCFYHYFAHAREIDLKRFPSINSIFDLLSSVGFKDICSYSCRIDDAVDDRPSSYLERSVRDGCSSFAFLSREEVEEGCKKISQDLKSGKVNEVVERGKKKTERIGGNATFIKGVKQQLINQAV